MAEVELWLHPDIFYYGIIYAHPKLTIPYLKKVVAYTKSKGKDGGYPELNWLIWKHMAVNKMLMAEELAWAYFRMFCTLHGTSVKERLEFAEKQQQLAERGDFSSYKAYLKVPTLEFVLFLYMQQANKTSLRKSLLGDEWPGASPRMAESPSHSSRSEAGTNMLDERKHNQFVISHFAQIMALLSEGYKGQDSSKQNPIVPPEVVKALGFIIHGRVIRQNNVYTLYDIAVRHRIQSKSGYIRSTGCFSAQTFENWFGSVLSENPYGLANCITSGTKLKWCNIDTSSNRKKARVSTNTLSAPRDHKLIFFSQCSNQTVARQSVLLNGAYAKLHRCHSTYFYLLSPLKCVSIEKCTSCCIVLGPVATCVKIVNCQDTKIIVPCQSITISSSSGITVYITTPTRPIVLSDNNTTVSDPPVTFAPYNTFYPQLENHLSMVGLTVSPQTDQWNNAVCVGNKHNLSLSHSRLSDVVRPRSPRFTSSGDTVIVDEEETFFTIMKPGDFYVYTIPFKMDGSSRNRTGKYASQEVFGELPTEFAKAVTSKQRATDRWRKAVKDSNMTKDERCSFQLLVEEKFKAWVSETDNQRQLDHLGKINTSDS